MDDLHCNRDTEFNLFLAIEALQGITEALHELTTEIPRSGAELSHWVASVSGLTWAGARIAQETRHFMDAASEEHRFPSIKSELGGK